MESEQRITKPTTTRTMLASYIIGFVLSVLLTITAYISVANHVLAGWAAIAVIVGLAVTQLLVQLLFFLHLGRESKPRYQFVIFLFMLLVLGILVIGSLWIMHNLDYHMTPADMDKYMTDQLESGGF
jgi:cytochrome o ubiquinol oxidase operon protein cyoD